MFQPFRTAVQQFRLAPAQCLGPVRVDGSPDAVAIRDHQQVLRHVPDAVALPGLFLHPLRQRRVEFGELIGKLAVSLFAAPKLGLAFPQRGGRKIIFRHIPTNYQYAADAVVLVDRAEAVGPVDVLQSAMARHRNELVLMPGGAAAAHHLLDLRTDDVPAFGPALPSAPAERAWMAFGSQGLPVGA